MTRAPVALVAALRETSILIGALLGFWLLGERFGACRVVLPHQPATPHIDLVTYEGAIEADLLPIADLAHGPGLAERARAARYAALNATCAVVFE